MPGYLSDLRRGAARNALTQHGKPLDPMRGPPEVKPTPESLLQGMPEGWTEMSPEFQALGPAEQDLIRTQASQGPVSEGVAQQPPESAPFHGVNSEGPPDVASTPPSRSSRPGVVRIPQSEGMHFDRPLEQAPRAAPPASPAQADPPARQSSTDRTRRK
mgnify:FL=1